MEGMKLLDLSGKTALMTGGGSGLGKAIAKGLASAGQSPQWRTSIMKNDTEVLIMTEKATGAKTAGQTEDKKAANGLTAQDDAWVMPDWRWAGHSWEIPTELYADQPYLLRTDDGAWLCVLTTGAGREGQSGQHVISLRSTDMGKTWSEPIDVEPADGPEASYAVLLKADSGRIYCFYNHNTGNVRKVKADMSPWSPDGYFTRVDSLGYFVFKYSDDHGRTWSDKRCNIPVREFACDRNNADGGKIRYFWNVGKPVKNHGAAYVPLIKVGRMGNGFFAQSEGALLRSANILTESDPGKITWETLPDGEVGLRTPPGGGPVAEEQSCSVLSDGSFYCVYRSIDGHPVYTCSRDGGHTWDEPKYQRYADGRLMKHPRAANFAWKCSNGQFLYWFHNHGGAWYEDRNPVWVCGGVEKDGPDGKVIAWTQPEILLYEDDTFVRMSYPDLIEDGGKVFITETNKNAGRVHEIPESFLSKLWSQFAAADTEKEGLLLELHASGGIMGSSVAMAELPKFLIRDHNRADYGTLDRRAGFTLELAVESPEFPRAGKILDTRTENGQGICVETDENGSLGIALNDGSSECRWSAEPGILEPGKLNHLGIVVDGGPKVISFVVNGRFCDGGQYRQFGWGRFSRDLRHANGAKTAILGDDHIVVRLLRVYGRALMTTELVGNCRALFAQEKFL